MRTNKDNIGIKITGDYAMKFVDEEDKIFFDDFRLMCQELQARHGTATAKYVQDNFLPPEFGHKYRVNNNKLVGIYNIEDDEVFERLNNTDAVLYGKKDKVPIYNQLKRKFEWQEGYFRRKIDADGNFMKYKNDRLKCANPYVEYYGASSDISLEDLIKNDTNDNIKYEKKPIYYYEPVEIPPECKPIVSDYAIGWSKDQKHRSDLGYIDRLDNPNNYDKDFNQINDLPNKYLYFVPKRNLFYLNQTALALSPRSLPNCYYGVRLTFTNGQHFFLQVVDFKPGQINNRDYVYLCTKTSTDYMEEITALRDYWMEKHILFDPVYCELNETVMAGPEGKQLTISNLAWAAIQGNKETYVKYDVEKSLAGYEEFFSSINYEEGENNDKDS